MQHEQPSSPAEPPAWWHEVSWPARAAFACGMPVALGLVACEAALGRALGPEHPLSIGRLSLRVGCFLACGVSFAVASTGALRARRRAARLRDGLCPTCGYDLRAARSDRCPECGSPRARWRGA